MSRSPTFTGWFTRSRRDKPDAIDAEAAARAQLAVRKSLDGKAALRDRLRLCSLFATTVDSRYDSRATTYLRSVKQR